MTTDLKAGKECRLCEGKGERIIKWPEWAQARIEKCCDCKGLGWIPAPGDALTAEEAEVLNSIRKNVEERVLGVPYAKWVPFVLHRPEWIDLYEFRLAPAPQEETNIMPCFKCGAGLMRPQGMHVGYICDNCGAQKDFDKEEPAAKGESVEEHLANIVREALVMFRLTQTSDLYPQDHWSNRAERFFSLTPAKLEALRKEQT